MREGSDGFTILRVARVEGWRGVRLARTEALEKGVSVGNTVEVLGWYDNERGFSNRTVEMVKYIGKRL